MAGHPFEADQEAELDNWPGVTWRREHRGKHLALVLAFDGVSRFVIYPTSPGDTYRGSLNHLRDVRAALSALGAKRVQPAKANRPRRRPVTRPLHHEAPLAGGVQSSSRLGRDPFAALASLRVEEPAPEPALVSPELSPSLLRRARQFFRSIFGDAA